MAHVGQGSLRLPLCGETGLGFRVLSLGFRDCHSLFSGPVPFQQSGEHVGFAEFRVVHLPSRNAIHMVLFGYVF